MVASSAPTLVLICLPAQRPKAADPPARFIRQTIVPVSYTHLGIVMSVLKKGLSGNRQPRPHPGKISQMCIRDSACSDEIGSAAASRAAVSVSDKAVSSEAKTLAVPVKDIACLLYTSYILHDILWQHYQQNGIGI